MKKLIIILVIIAACLFVLLSIGNNRNEMTDEENVGINTNTTNESTTQTELDNTDTTEETAEPESTETIEPTEEPEEPTEEPKPEPKPEEPKEEEQLISLGEFKLTAYCPCEKCNGKWAGGLTSTGAIAKAGHTIAVDPKVISYGSKVVINGHTYTAEDCGGAIKGNRIDIYFNTHEEALDFGVRYAEVFLVNN